jgi:hypothetical protein
MGALPFQLPNVLSFFLQDDHKQSMDGYIFLDIAGGDKIANGEKAVLKQ